MSAEILEIQVGKKAAFIHPGEKKDVAFVIGHGASGDCNSGNLPEIATRVNSELGITVIRYNAGGPLKSRITTLKALLDHDDSELKQIKTWILSGHSMGGRTACAIAAEKSHNIAAVVLFSYPLHPPGKKDELRDEDLTALTCPLLIVRGTKDTFSTEPIFSDVMERMSSTNLQIEMVEGGDHSLSTKTGPGQERFDKLMKKVEQFISTVSGDISGPISDATEDEKPSKAVKRKKSIATISNNKRKASKSVKTAKSDEQKSPSQSKRKSATADASTPAKTGKKSKAGKSK